MTDAGGIRETVLKAFAAAYAMSRLVRDVLRRIDGGLADYSGLAGYPEHTGLLLSRALLGAIDEDCLEDGVFRRDVADGVVAPGIREAYSKVAGVAALVQGNINRSAGIGLEALTGKIDPTRVTNLEGKLTGRDYEETKWLLGGDVLGNIARSAVTDTIRENAKFHKEAGIHPYLRRYSDGKCCDWCDSMLGAYEYGEQPENFWRIHKDCTCVIEYRPSKYKRANIVRYVTGDNGAMRKVTEAEGDESEVKAGDARGKIGEMKEDNKSSDIPESIRGNFDDFEPLSLTENEKKALADLRKQSDQGNCEYGVFVKGDKTGELFTSNIYDKVKIDKSQITPGTTIFHSHTNDTPFSTQDFLFLLDERVEKIGVIAYNNDTFIASVGNGWRPSREEFENITNAIDNSVIADLPDMPDFFEWTEEQKNYMRVREKAYRIAREFDWKLEGGNIDE